MIFQLKKLTGCVLCARDGDIGQVEDFYFDDEKWTIRYIVADTAKWLLGRKILIPRVSLGAVHLDTDKLEIRLTKTQIENSPGIDAHKPISRQNEADLYDYYGYSYYWPGPNFTAPVPFPIGMPERKAPMAATEAKEIDAAQRKKDSEEPHLRSAAEVTGYYIHARDGDLGHVEDFLIDDESWTVRYVVVDTKNWWPGKKVLIAPQWITELRWGESIMRIDMSRESIKSSPEYDPALPLDRNYEQRLHEHHGRQKYWVT